MTPGLLLALSVSAVLGGVIGSLLGLGGGVIIVPVYTLALGLPVHVAVGTSLVAVVANASSAATIYLKSRLTNLRLALVLASVTAAGSLLGGLVATALTAPWLFGIFGFLLVGVGALMLVRPETRDSPPGPAAPPAGPEGLEAQLAPASPGGSPPPSSREGELEGWYYDPASKKSVAYRPHRVRAGLGLSFIAGNVSGMLGIGGGVIQVPVMNLVLGMPIKASTATSSHIISLTAVTGALVYVARGYVDPTLTAVTIIGVYLGSRAGARLNQVLPGLVVKRVFSVLLLYMAFRMLATAFNLPLPG